MANVVSEAIHIGDDPPSEGIKLFIYPLGYGWKDPLMEVLFKNIEVLSDAIGKERLVVIGPRNTEWFEKIGEKYFGPDVDKYRQLLPAILITDATLRNVNADTVKIFVPLGTVESRFGNWTQFLTLLVRYLVYADENFIHRLEPRENVFALANEIVKISPGLFGISVNVNKLLERIRNSKAFTYRRVVSAVYDALRYHRGRDRF